MGAQGSDTIDFGTFPGGSDTFKDIAVASVLTSSAVEAWVRIADTADHLADEHWVETFEVKGCCLVNGTIRVYGKNTGQISEPSEDNSADTIPNTLSNTGAKSQLASSDMRGTFGGRGTRIYGLWSIWWVWN